LTDLYEIWYVDAKMGFLTGPTVKKSKFQKFETADAAILKKKHLFATVRPFSDKIWHRVAHISPQNLA